MAENTRTQTKAAIKRASAKARSAGNKLDRKALDELTVLYKNAADELRQLIQSYAGDDGSLKLEVLNELLEQTNARLLALQQARDTLLEGKIFDGATLGVSPFIAGEVATSLVATQVAHDAVQQVYRFIAEDGLQLSDRLWRIDNHAKQVVGDAIQSAIIQGSSAANAALDFISSGEQIPRDIAAKMISANGDSIGRDVVNQLMRQKGSPYDNALRVFRTEINRAHGNAYEDAAFDHPDVVGTRFLLSPNHPKVDICDLHAKANIYGLGPGVYPKNKNPLPAHPNTLSYLEAVFSDEVTAEDRAGKTNRVEWLKKQSSTRQNSILGLHKAWMLREGRLRDNAINTPWSTLKKRLEKSGVVIPAPADLSPSPSFNSETSIINIVEATTYFEQVDLSLAAIDKVHSIRGLPTIGVVSSRATDSNGFYNTANRIGITGIATEPAFTLTHEIGHFIDHRGFAGLGFSSESSELFESWRKAVAKSPEIQNLLDALEGKLDRTVGSISVVHSVKHTTYLLQEREIWARSYSQWIARKSGDKTLNQQLDSRLNRQRNSVLKFTYQWDDDNFEAISSEIDAIFTKVGWLR